MKRTSDDVRALALIGARVRREELRAQLAELESTIKALQGVVSGPARKPRKRTRYNDKFKADVLAEAKATSVPAAAKKYGVPANQVYKWRRA